MPKIKELLGTSSYHRRIQSKHSRTKGHPHERATRMLQSILNYSIQPCGNHVVTENYTSDCDFNSYVNHDKKSQKVDSFTSHKLAEFVVVIFFNGSLV